MNRKSFILTLGVLFIFASRGHAAEKALVLNASSVELMTQMNPFKPQFPEPPKKKEPEQPPSDDTDRDAKRRQAIQETKKTTESKSVAKAEIKKPEPPKLTITGVVWDTNRPQAIINGQVVDIGDSIDNAKILAIRKTGIDINFSGTNMTITP